MKCVAEQLHRPSVTVNACDLLLFNQRNSVRVEVVWGGRQRGWELDWYAHWISERSNGSVVVDTRGVQGVEEINESVVYEFFQVEDELTNCSRDFSRVIPPENMDDGALIDGVIRIDDLWARESEEEINGNEDYADGVTVNGTSPLKVMICSEREGGMNKSFPKGREGAIVRLMN